MLEALVLAAALSQGCVERDASTFGELLRNNGASIVECAAPDTTEVWAHQTITLAPNGALSVVFSFEDGTRRGEYAIGNCNDLDLGEEGLGRGLLPDIRCNGSVYYVDIDDKGLAVMTDQTVLYRLDVTTRYIAVNNLLFELPAVASR